MIPAGRTYVTAEEAAEILGVALSTFQTRRYWEKFPAGVKSFSRVDPEAKRPLRLWDKEQLTAYAAQRELPLDRMEIPVLPLDPQNREADRREGDLLDWVEAWESMPAGDRPDKDTWADYIKARSKTGPAADETIGGTRYWKRGTVRHWNETRPKGKGSARTGGRKAGSANSVAIVREDAVERVRRTAELLGAAAGSVSGAVIARQLVEEFGFTLRTGERLVADTHKGLGVRERAAELQQEHWDEPRERTVKVLADELGLTPAVAAFVLEDVLAQQAQGRPRGKKK